MDDFTALSELRNQQCPVRRNGKTYGKKKTIPAERRAMHFDLFGGGRDENNFVSNTAAPEDEEVLVEDMKRLTVLNHATVINELSTSKSTSTPKQKQHEKHPRLRGRRKATSHKKMAVSPSHAPNFVSFRTHSDTAGSHSLLNDSMLFLLFSHLSNKTVLKTSKNSVGALARSTSALSLAKDRTPTCTSCNQKTWKKPST